MSDVQQQTAKVLTQLSALLREARPGGAIAGELERLALAMDRLAGQVDQPCVVAVVGQVKAGKSRFLNALLGEDLARVGTTETTATINWFRYGHPDPARPVRCHWRSGQVTEETREFLDGLQGNDLETLRRADGIDHLEYLVPNPFLLQVTLVDTPGTGAVVEEHQTRTTEFIRLQDQLRERHHGETEQLGSRADAVIYLVGPVARASDRDFLEQFSRATGGRSRAMNAVGVLAKVDLYPAVLERRHELADRVAAQLREELNTVLPVSAALERSLDELGRDNAAAFRRLERMFFAIPANQVELLLDSDELFRQEEIPGCPESPAERAALLNGIKWGVFRAVAQVAADRSPATAQDKLARLREMAGFSPLREALTHIFFERGHLLRCFRIVLDARRQLDTLRFTHLPAARRRDREDAQRLARFLVLLQECGGSLVAAELEEFLHLHLDGAAAGCLEEIHGSLDRTLSALLHDLSSFNEDFECLQRLQRSPGELPIEELEELRPLLGLYGTDPGTRLRGQVDAAYVRERMRAWRQIETFTPHGSPRHAAAQRAAVRYGILLDRFLAALPGLG